MPVHISGIVGFSPHANQRFFTSCDERSDTTRLHRLNALHSVLRLPIRHRLPMKARTKTSGTTKCQSQQEQREQKKRKEIKTDETAKELRAPLHIADPEGRRDIARCLISIPEGTLQTSEEWIPSSEDGRNAKQQQEEHVVGEGRRKEPSLPILHARCASRSQRDETHRVDKWTKFDAVIILTDEEVRLLTEAGCEIYPMNWVDTDKNTYLRRDDDYVSVLAKYRSRLVGCGNIETTEGLRTDSRAGDADSHNIVCSWCAQAHVSTHSCVFTNGHFEGQEIDRILLCRIPTEKELQAERF